MTVVPVSIGAPQVPLVVFISEQLVQQFCFVDRRTRAGLNLDGRTLRFNVRASLAEAALITKVTAAGIVHADQGVDPGLMTLTVDAADNALAQLEHIYDIWIDDVVWIAPSPYDVQLSVRQP